MGGASLSPNRWIRQRSSGLHRPRPRPRSGGGTTEEALKARQPGSRRRWLPRRPFYLLIVILAVSGSRCFIFVRVRRSALLLLLVRVGHVLLEDGDSLSTHTSHKMKTSVSSGCCYLRPVRHHPLGHAHRLGGGSGTRRLGLGRDANFDLRSAANFGGAAAFLRERR